MKCKMELIIDIDEIRKLSNEAKTSSLNEMKAKFDKLIKKLLDCNIITKELTDEQYKNIKQERTIKIKILKERSYLIERI